MIGLRQNVVFNNVANIVKGMKKRNSFYTGPGEFIEKKNSPANWYKDIGLIFERVT